MYTLSGTVNIILYCYMDGIKKFFTSAGNSEGQFVFSGFFFLGGAVFSFKKWTSISRPVHFLKENWRGGGWGPMIFVGNN